MEQPAGQPYRAFPRADVIAAEPQHPRANDEHHCLDRVAETASGRDDRDGLGVQRDDLLGRARSQALRALPGSPQPATNLALQALARSGDGRRLRPLGAVPRRSPPSRRTGAGPSTRARVHASSRTRCSAPAGARAAEPRAPSAPRARRETPRATVARSTPGTSAPRPPARPPHAPGCAIESIEGWWFAHSHRTFPDAVAEGRGDSGCTPTAHRRRPAEVVAPSPP